MQHTQKYQLNLIDPSDEFLPDPLNQNMETVETQLQAREAAEAALDTKFTAAIGSGGKTARIAWGSYEGTGEYGKEHPTVLTFDFKPHLVLVQDSYSYHLMLRGVLASISKSIYSSVVSWDENSVSWHNSSPGYQLNDSGLTFYYAAIGESLN